MEHIENDMDDLFQKAGELYPLKTTGSDWDAVAGKLQNESSGEVHDLTGSAAVPTSRKTWLFLLLLIPLGLGIYYFSGNLNPERQNSVLTKPLNGSAGQNKINSVIPDNQVVPAGPTDNSKRDNNKATASDNIQGEPGKKNNSANSSMNGNPSTKNRKLIYVAVGGKRLTENNMLNSENQISSADDKSKSDLNSINSGQGSKDPKTVDANNTIDNSSSSGKSEPKTAVAVIPPVMAAQNEKASVGNNTDKTASSKKASADSSQTKKKTNTALRQSKGFYVGLFAGPDVSTVKFQSVNNLGFSLGAIIGYRFSNRLSVETGLTWDKKYYYSSGEYYKGVTLPANTTLDGNCSMFEIPVDIRLDFATKKNHGFFAKTGLSSYLMTSENYTFNYPNYSRPWKNDSLKNNIFSILQVSGGYERVINDKTKIRVEPYVKIPLQGVGKGDMPIASFGIYIGITHSFR